MLNENNSFINQSINDTRLNSTENFAISSDGFSYNNKKYKPFTSLPLHMSALYSVSASQKITLLFVISLFVIGLLVNWQSTLIVGVSIITILYFIDLLFSFYLIVKGYNSNDEIRVDEDKHKEIRDGDLPMYTILCPLYKEKEVISQFVYAIEQIDYPKEKLQVLLLLEQDDVETINAAYNLSLPSYFTILVVPDTLPKTKPKACNYGLIHATGEYCVIYDAEDVPEKDQLRKVVYAFKKSGPQVGCIQAKLNFYNPDQNILTKLFTLEYSLWFDLILTGLQSIHAPIPLGGTSNHFPKKVLTDLGGWDAFNVTEDCDLGIRLAKSGFKTAIIDSTTYEEANSELKNWFNQRSRWIKGYIQTYFVHMRDISSFSKENILNFPAFQLIVGGKVLSLYINPIMWAITISYFVFRSSTGAFIESLYVTPIFYMGAFSLFVGNFIYFYNYMLGSAKRGRYDMVKYAFFVPIYWLFMSFASWLALYRLVRTPHHWSKTKHGLHLKKNNNQNELSSIAPNSIALTS